MATPLGSCPNCRQMNAYTAVNCIDCGARLPWADVAEETLRAQEAARQAQAQAYAAVVGLTQPVPNPPVPPGVHGTVYSTQGQLKFCPNCSTRIPPNFTLCPKCGTPATPSVKTDDAPSFGIAFLGFLLPIGGFLIWAIQKNDYPERAASAGKGALVGLFIGSLLTGVYFQENNKDIPFVSNPFSSTIPVAVNKSSEYEQLVKDGLNEKYREKGLDLTCVSVSLVRETPNKYTGFATLSDGDKPNAEVVIGENDELIWKVGGL